MRSSAEMTPEVFRSLVIMAAGAGSRFGGPKQTAPLGPHGEWLLEFSIFDAIRAGFRRMVLVTREELEPEFRARFERIGQGVEFEIAVQRIDDIPAGFSSGDRKTPWGTGQALLAARQHVEGAFAIANADDFYGASSYGAAADACERASQQNTATVIGLRLDRTLSSHGPVKRAWCQTRGDHVTRIEELMSVERRGGRLTGTGREGARTFTGAELVSMNFWVFPADVFQRLAAKFETFLGRHADDPAAEFLLPEAVSELIAEGVLSVRVVETRGPWFGLTYPEDRAAAEASLAALTRSGVYPTPLWGGVSPARPADSPAPA